MSWFSFALALLSIVKSILGMVERKKAQNAAEAAILLSLLSEADVRLKAASDAELAARNGKLSDDDFRD